MNAQSPSPGLDLPGRQPCAAPSWSDADRLAALERYAILDTGREQAFDEIAGLAADLLDAPMAVVNFVAADRQWFKAEVGIGQDSLPLDVSICRHILLQPGVTVIPDLRADPRFENNPLVLGDAGLRFYAGALMETPDGLPLGTVCVLDREPRPQGIGDRQRRALAALAAQAMTQLELRRAEAVATAERDRAERRAKRLSLLAEASTLLLAAPDPADCVRELYLLVADGFRVDIGFHYRCTGERLALAAALGLTPEQEADAASIGFGELVCGTVAQRCESIHVENIPASGDPLHAPLQELGLHGYHCSPLFGVTGELLGTLSFGRRAAGFTPGEIETLGTLAAQLATALGRDAADQAARAAERRRTALLALEERLRDLADPAEPALAAAEILGEALGACRVGYGEIDAEAGTVTVGRTWSLPGFPDVTGEHDFTDYGTYLDDLRQGRAVAVSNVATGSRTADRAAAFAAIGVGAHLDVPVVEGGRTQSQIFVHSATPRVWHEEEIAFVRDVAGRTRAAVARRTAEAELAEEVGAMRRLQRVSTLLVAENDPETLYRHILDAAADLMGADCANLQMLDAPSGVLRLLASNGLHPDTAAFLASVDRGSHTNCAEALVSGRRVVVGDVEDCAFMAGSAALEAYRRSGIRAVQSTPLIAHSGQLVGMISTYWRTPHEPDERSLRLCDLLARQASDAIERALSRAAITESESRFHNIADHAPVMMWVTAADGTCTYLNRLWYGFTGQTPQEAGGFGWLEATHPRDKAEAERVFLDANARQAPFRLDYRLRRADGVYRWCIDAASPRFGDGGEFLGYVGSVIDIDERREVEERLRTSEVRFRTLTEATNAVVWSIDAMGAMAAGNPSWAAFTGQSQHEYAGWGWLEAVHPDDRAHLLEAARAAFDARAPYQCEYRLRRADGEYRWTLARGACILSATGEPIEWMGANADITERRQAEDRVRESEARFRAMADAAPALVWVNDAQGRCDFVNAEYLRFFGKSMAEVAGFGWVPSAHPDDGDRYLASYLEAVAARVPFKGDARFLDASGTYRCLETTAAPRLSADGDYLGHVGISVDVTERKAAEDDLAAARARLERVLALTPTGILEFDAEGRFTYANAAGERMVGLSLLPPAERRIDAAAWAIETPDGLPIAAHDLPGTRALRGETVAGFEHALVDAASGERRILAVDASPVRDADGAVTGGVASLVDVTARKAAEAALRLRTDELETLLASSPLGVCFFDREHRWLRINAELAAVNGYPVEDHIGRRMEELLPVSAAWVGPMLDHVFASGETLRNIEVSGETADAPGVPRHWLVSYYPVRGAAEEVVAVGTWVVEITDRKEAEAALERLNAELSLRVEQALAERETALAQLHEAQKLETIGQLTGGVAHDFNNLLTPIVGGLDMLKRRGLPDARAERMIDGALQSAERARLLVQRLLAFARRQHLQAQPVDVAALIGGMRDLVERSLGPTIAVEVQLAPGLPAALVDPNQLELALLNLAVNARDAMPEGGTLTIAVQETEEAEEAGAGRYVRLAVTDTGTGMDAETLRRCVEPFFTSKGVGKGTGLGLSMVHGLAAQSGGRLSLASQPGAGTTAELWLPVADGAAIEPDRASSCEFAPPPRRSVVLLVDDEELVRQSTADMLEEFGYEVRQASGGAEALELLRPDDAVDLLVTDYLMPGMTGAELAAAARRSRPGLPVLIITGYSRLDEVGDDLMRLEKPFRQVDLAAAVADLMLGAQGRGPAAR